MPPTALVQRIVDWLRAGYPHGVPEHDYVPLFALLGQQLSTVEVEEVADDLIRRGTAVDGQEPTAAIRAAVLSATGARAEPADIARVRARLEAVGWDPSPA